MPGPLVMVPGNIELTVTSLPAISPAAALLGAAEAILALRRRMDDHLRVLPASHDVTVFLLRGVGRATDAGAPEKVRRVHYDGATALVLDAQVDVGVGRDAQFLRLAAGIAVLHEKEDFRRPLLLIRGLRQRRARGENGCAENG